MLVNDYERCSRQNAERNRPRKEKAVVGGSLQRTTLQGWLEDSPKCPQPCRTVECLIGGHFSLAKALYKINQARMNY
jgi:hypothetical protein